MKTDFLSIIHFAITVKDIHETAEFYRDNFGFEIGNYRENVCQEEYGQITGMENALLKIVNITGFGAVIELVQYVDPKSEEIDLSTNNIGVAHICFQVQNIHELYDELKSKGIDFVWKEPVYVDGGVDDGCYAVYGKDLNGFTLEFYQAPEK